LPSVLSRGGREEGLVIVGKDGVEKQLPLDQTRKFSVFEREKITLAIGDRIRFTKTLARELFKPFESIDGDRVLVPGPGLF
jgi:hypothetical protein